MTINHRLIETTSLALLLFFLCLKTSQVTIDSEEWEVINLPHFIFFIGSIASSLAAAALVAYVGANIRSAGLHLTVVPIAIVFTSILCYYHLRSFQAGSGDIKNILAIGVAILSLLAFSMNRNNSSNKVIYALIISFGGFTLISLVIYIFGYGFPVSGNGRRFFGLTPHPNFQGTYSALAFAVFLTIASWNPLNFKRRLISLCWCVGLISAYLVVVSGSRTALALVFIAILLGPRLKHKIYIGLFLSSIFLTMGATILALPDSILAQAISRIQDAPIDNRSEVWGALIDDFTAFPYMGAGDRSGVSGSAYLTAFGGTGFIIGSVFLLCTAFSLRGCIKRISIRNARIKIDSKFIFALLLLQILSGSFFEGYMFDKFGLIQILTILLLCQLGARARTSSNLRPHASS